MSKQVANVLRAAADLIEPEGRWTVGALARTKDGKPLYYSGDILSDKAQCFCALGAITKAFGGLPHGSRVLENFCRVISTNNVGDWNDAPERTQAEVVAKLREVADLAEAQA